MNTSKVPVLPAPVAKIVDRDTEARCGWVSPAATFEHLASQNPITERRYILVYLKFSTLIRAQNNSRKAKLHI
tara:strand:+ start:218 stop:436 length:219 start_codon:yes stop_codon:yes gene_type:complete